jgi:FAD binding domain
MKKMEIIVVGGGIVGLSLVLSLHHAGYKVRVYEAVRDLLPLGVGINLQPTAVRELVELGLGDALTETGIATQRLNLYNKFGQLIRSEPRGLAAGYDGRNIRSTADVCSSCCGAPSANASAMIISVADLPSLRSNKLAEGSGAASRTAKPERRSSMKLMS